MEHGWISLSLDRLADLKDEFPEDPEVLYTEGLIRKDFLGQGLRAEELFIAAQKFDKNPSITNDNFRMATFNAAKYARSESEFRHQVSIALRLFSNDQGFMQFKQQIESALQDGINYADVMTENIIFCQQRALHGDCAAFAEIALQAGEHNINEELALHDARFRSLRELDKAAEATRRTRGEDFPPIERLALKEAMNEVNLALELDPNIYINWNLKSAWHIFLREFLQGELAANKAIELCPIGYYKAKINKAMAAYGLDRKDEAKLILNAVLAEIDQVSSLFADDEQDRELAESKLRALCATQASDDVVLKSLAERIIQSAHMTRKKDLDRRNSKDGEVLLNGLEQRVRILGNKWNMNYIKIMAELLVYFSSEISCIAVIRLREKYSDKYFKEYTHCVHAVLYIIAHAHGVMRRDACRFFIYFLLGTLDPEKILKDYRKAILGPTAVGSDGFENLESYMLEEMERLNPELIRLISKQPPLTHQELEWARNVTMARFTLGVDRDPVPYQYLPKSNKLFGFLGRLFGRR